jgi:acetyl-CoA acetyltransferase
MELGTGRKSTANFQVFSGGSSTGNILKTAAGLIATGLAKNVLCVHSDKLATGISAQGGIDLFSTAGISAEWEVPFGMHYSAIAALTMQRFMFETGTTAEQWLRFGI